MSDGREELSWIVPRQTLTTGEMARLSNSTLRTVRFYEEEGLLEPLERSDGGHRLFPQSELDKLRLVGELRLVGLSLEEIKALLEAKRRSDSGAAAARDVDDQLGHCALRLAERIEVLQKLKEQIDAARRVIQRCETCTHNHLFPESCGECRTMKDAGDLPPAATVLWGLKR